MELVKIKMLLLTSNVTEKKKMYTKEILYRGSPDSTILTPPGNLAIAKIVLSHTIKQTKLIMAKTLN